MPLNNYALRAPSVVIEADQRDPYVSWRNHLARTYGLRGGVDIVAAVGTPIYARTAGRMVNVPDDGSAGNSSRFYHRDNPGWKDVFSHLSSYRTPKNPQGLSGFQYEAGDIIAYTGNTGGVTQHLHWHLLDPSDIRRNPWDYFTNSSTAGGGLTPIDNTSRKDPDMPKLTRDARGTVFIVDDQGADNIAQYFSVPGVDGGTWMAVIQRLLGNWDQLANVESDFANHIINMRAAQKRAMTVTDTVNALRPVIQAMTPTIDNSVIEKTINDGLAKYLENVEVQNALSDEDVARFTEWFKEINENIDSQEFVVVPKD